MLLVAACGGIAYDWRGIYDLLRPLVGHSGSIWVVVAGIGQVGLIMARNRKRTGARVRPGGLALLERDTGWVVVDPDEVIAVGWSGDTDKSVGQFL